MQPLQSRKEIVEAFQEGLVRFSALVRPLTVEQLATPSRCEGWSAGDVAGHYVGSITEIAAGEVEGQGTPAVTKRQVEARKGRSGAELADELDAAATAVPLLLAAFPDDAWDAPLSGFDGTLAQGVEALLFDGAVHADDIDAALHLGHHPTQAELVAAVSHVAFHLCAQNWGPATLALDGIPEVEIGDGGPRISGNPGTFVLAATGRGNPAEFGLDDTVNIYR
ncbi:MAG TPA: maleylpyruvate isomerase family mycothiol-dependent enzyme [Candidatus Limnocylindrales bacterium]|nr:maleylpyruvate isomerase family mycothiol-dependent enzyme [Candidatus Limnocylindrales bacterium]